jgi:hypothetical protein
MKSELNWSYPSSPNACRAGMAKTGCWTVTLADGSTRHFAEYDDAQREFPAEAERYLESRPKNYVTQLNEMGVTRPLSRAIRVF